MLPIGLGVGVGLLLFALLGAAIGFCLVKQQRKKKKPDEEDALSNATYGPTLQLTPLSTGEEPTTSKHSSSKSLAEPVWKIRYEELEIAEELGRGSFGVVRR